MDHENFFLLLELDPDQFTTWAAIEPKLRQKRNEWSTRLNSPDRDRYKKYLELIPRIEEELKDDAKRQEHAEKARELLRQRSARMREELEEFLRITGAKDYLTPEDIKILVDKGAGRWTDKDIRSLASTLGISIQQAKANDDPRPSIPESVIREIESLLKLVGKADLYDLLDADRASSAKVLKARADEMNKSVRTWLKNAENTARLKLTGHCGTFFKSEADRALYDRALQWLKLESIREWTLVAGTGEGRISLKVVEELIRRGKMEGIEQDRVIEAVSEVCKQRKWEREVPGSAVVPDTIQRCGRCRELAADSATHCKNGHLLKKICPVCQTANPSDAPTCRKPGCSFAIGDMNEGERNVKQAIPLLKSEPIRAKQLLTQALIYWPNHPQAVQLLAELKKLEDEAKRREEELQQLVDRINKACADRLFLAARTAVDELERRKPDHPKLADFRKDIKSAFTAADAEVQKAQAALQKNKGDDAIDAFTAALGFCADYPAAKSGLKSCPPEPPLQPSHTMTAAGVTLSWRASPSRGRLMYRVVRKVGSQPTSAGDGETLGKLSASPFTDDKGEVGRLYYYGIFTERSEVCSDRPAIVAAVRVGEVLDLHFQVGSGRVELTWKAPPNLRGIEIWRQPHTEPKRNEGTRVTTVLGSSAVDTGLANGTTYGYRVIALFDGPSGKLASPGRTCLATPAAPPEPIKDMEVNRDGNGHFEVTWQRPPVGEVRIYQVQDPAKIAYKVGQFIPVTELDRLGKRLPASRPGAARDRLNDATVLHLLPVTIAGQSAVAGRFKSVSWVDEVEQLRAWTDGTALYVQWDFPSGFDLALVAFRPDDFPTGPDDPQAQRFNWSRAQSQLDGRFHCTAPNAERIYLTVFTAVNRGDGWHYAAGNQLVVPLHVQQRCQFRVRPIRRFGMLATGEWEVMVRANADVLLPDLILVASPTGYPVAPEKGDVIHRLGPISVGPRCPVRAVFTPPAWFDPRRARLFPARIEDGGWLELIEDG